MKAEVKTLESSPEDIAQNQSLALSPCSLSPGFPHNASPQPQTTDLLRGEHHRGRRSSRTRFTEQQLETLQGVFEATPYPREEEYDRLSALLSLPNRVIVVWFQNARQRARKTQDRGTDDGLEDEGQGDSQNENSMDLTYEYYTQPDSPALDSSTHCTESEHPLPSYSKQTPCPVAAIPLTRTPQRSRVAVAQRQTLSAKSRREHKPRPVNHSFPVFIFSFNSCPSLFFLKRASLLIQSDTLLQPNSTLIKTNQMPQRPKSILKVCDLTAQLDLQSTSQSARQTHSGPSTRPVLDD
uniref:Homeobox domain-containing protein n=1 Tax=Neolamprologus brichardi TaxID=32507 RepID=A0A3Q4IDY1_NEOBR